MQDQGQRNEAAEPGSGGEEVRGVGNNVNDASPPVLDLGVPRPGQRYQKKGGEE